MMANVTGSTTDLVCVCVCEWLRMVSTNIVAVAFTRWSFMNWVSQRSVSEKKSNLLWVPHNCSFYAFLHERERKREIENAQTLDSVTVPCSDQLCIRIISNTIILIYLAVNFADRERWHIVCCTCGSCGRWMHCLPSYSLMLLIAIR